MLEPIENQYTKVGTISRPHGVTGELLVIPEIYAPTLFDALDLVHITNTRGDLIPARLESVRVQEKNNRLSFFVKFEHITDRTQAEGLKNFDIYADRKVVNSQLDSGDMPPDLKSFDVMANGQSVGTVKAIQNNPAHPILEVITTDKKQLLIPLVDEYVAGVDEESAQIQCQNLEQLKEL